MRVYKKIARISAKKINRSIKKDGEWMGKTGRCVEAKGGKHEKRVGFMMWIDGENGRQGCPVPGDCSKCEQSSWLCLHGLTMVDSMLS